MEKLWPQIMDKRKRNLLQRANVEDNSIELQYVDLKDADLADLDLSRADLSGSDLTGADLRNTKLTEANLNGSVLFDAKACDADLTGADLREANLSNACLSRASLSNADLRRAQLIDTDMEEIELFEANLSSAILDGSDLRYAKLYNTVLGDVDLSNTNNLESCQHWGASIVDTKTLSMSKRVPTEFWQGCGIPNWQIAAISLYDSSLSQQEVNLICSSISRTRNQASNRSHSCFISYSHRDADFASLLYRDLRSAGILCWFDKHDFRIGDRLRDAIDAAVRCQDKLILVLSSHSISSSWVEVEVETFLEKERNSKRSNTMLFPIATDDAFLRSRRAWAKMIARDRYIGDFKNWQNVEIYKKSLDRLITDLDSAD